jgi:thioredoxin reductase (NADPH)
VLVATGSSPKELGVPGEAEFRNRGVSYCATCDGPIYKGKDVVVVGCGNTGLQETEYLLMYVNSITLLAHRERIKAEKIHQERVLNHPKARCMFNYELIEIKGDQRIKSVLVRDKKNNEMLEIPTDAVFIYVGYRPATAFLKGLLALDSNGYIITDEKMRTSVEGIFAAGDVRANNPAKLLLRLATELEQLLQLENNLQTIHSHKRSIL